MGYIAWKKRQINGYIDWIKGTPPKKINAYNPAGDKPQKRKTRHLRDGKRTSTPPNNNPSTRGKQMKTHK